ncbi:helix-turn-helix domain-containing protein [Pontibacter sp. BT731]|uniref:helix-turn-helix domain-containing protein n=1 Tax=Pontibacter coccineus TaxID=3063328 RepID=UPI0026E379C5|nr:helix-turn-helix domain-containing protein [Pontibacter sp. BT731]MDO6392079.1 helix-turn-helix domain-containing protein [Pontibacter sp. BT731]
MQKATRRRVDNQTSNAEHTEHQIQQIAESTVGKAIKSFLSLIIPVIKEAVKEAIPNQSPSPIEPNEQFLNLKQAAVFMDCSKSTIRNRMKSGELKYYSSGRKLYFKKDDLIASAKASTDF